MKRKTKRSSKRRGGRGAKAAKPRHIVLDIGSEGGSPFYDDCPICQQARLSGAEVERFNPETGDLETFTPGAAPPGIEVHVATGDASARSSEQTLELPLGCRAGELLLILQTLYPDLVRGLRGRGPALERRGRRLAPHRVLHDGDRLRLVATGVVARRRPS